jgi:hypothetical protein
VGIIEGACALLLGQPMYRLYARHPAALVAVAAALMGSGGHASPQAVASLSQAFITFAMGFIRPPALEYCQVAHSLFLLICRERTAPRPCRDGVLPGMLAPYKLRSMLSDAACWPALCLHCLEVLMGVIMSCSWK